jgi:hypothetical protein
VLSPGDNGPVDQRNTSSATAVAAASPALGAGASDSTASATSSSTQAAPTNLNVSIRVGSPGADAPRTQVNTSTATSTIADPNNVAPTLGTLPDPNTANSAAQVDNASSVVQDLSQCGDTCPGPAQPSDASADPAGVAATGTASATAIQTAPTNVDVSIRVASPGQDGLATQVNAAPAKGSAVVSTVTTPTNLVVAVDVPGAPGQIVVPTGDASWTWSWTWTTGQAPTDPTATPTSSPSWTWTWTDPTTPASTATDTTDASPQPQSGQWIWTWDWTRPDGTTTAWTYSQPCSCSWVWTWSWTFPASTPSAPPPAEQPTIAAPPSNPTVAQTNQSSATAIAGTNFTGSQTVAVTTDGATATTNAAAQSIQNDQTATATADVAQTRPLNENVITAGEVDGVDQVNGVAATAIATALDESSQAVTQQQSATADGASHALTAVQQIETAQSAHAGAEAGQTDATNLNQAWSAFGPSAAKLGNVAQSNWAETLSIADVENAVQQLIQQSQIGGGADQEATATQTATTSQAQDAVSAVGQTHVTNVNNVAIPLYGSSNPPVDQSNHVSAVSLSYAESSVAQTATQSESGDGVEWHATSVQTADVKQSGKASSGASQSGRTNTSGWNGVVTPPTASTQPPTTVPSSTPTTSAMLRVVTAPQAVSTSGSSATGGTLAADVTVVGTWGTAVTHVVATPPAVVRTASKVTTIPSSLSQPQPLRLAAGSSPSAPAPQAPLPSKHNFNLLGSMSTAPPGLLLAGFAALLEPIKLAAPGVGRLQRDAPVLGRPVEASLRERPG